MLLRHYGLEEGYGSFSVRLDMQHSLEPDLYSRW